MTGREDTPATSRLARRSAPLVKMTVLLAPLTKQISWSVIPLAGFQNLALAPWLALRLAGLGHLGLGIGDAHPMIASEADRAARARFASMRRSTG